MHHGMTKIGKFDPDMVNCGGYSFNKWLHSGDIEWGEQGQSMDKASVPALKSLAAGWSEKWDRMSGFAKACWANAKWGAWAAMPLLTKKGSTWLPVQ